MKCPKCGTEIPDYAVYCPNCGSKATVLSLTEKLSYRALLTVQMAKVHAKSIVISILAVIVLIVSGFAAFELTKVEVPELENENIIEARNSLESIGFKDKHIEALDTDKHELDEHSDERYIVVSQTPEPGEKIHNFDGITIVCEDSYARFDEEIQVALNERYEAGSEIASENGYTVSLSDESGAVVSTPVTEFDKNDLIITDIKDVQHKEKAVSFEVVSEKAEQKKWTKLLDKLENENAEKAVDTVTDGGYDFYLHPITKDKYADKCDMTTGRDFIFLEPGNIDVVNKTIGLKVVSLKQKAFERKEKKLLKALKTKIPYVGLNEDYINKSKIGKADSYTEKGENDEKHVYKWKSDDGDYVPLVITCVNNKVTKVSKKYKYAFWKNSNMPDFSVDKDAIDKAKAQAKASASGSHRGATGKTRGGSGTMVWIPRTGHKYHSNPYCSGMVNPSEVSLSQAQAWGYGACKKCYG